MTDPIRTFAALMAHMHGATIRLRANVPGGQNDRFNIPAEIAIFVSPDLPGGCMVWGRTERGWHPNHGERSAVAILLAILPGKASPPEEEEEHAELPY